MSVFTVEDSSNITYLYGPDYPHIEDLTISREAVEKCLSNLNITKAAGPDSIPCRFLKELSFEIAPILSSIFQQSLKDDVVPSDWKNADVAPAFKKGGRNLAENYRPISLTCVCCKMLEHIISSHIRHHLDNYGTILFHPYSTVLENFSHVKQLAVTIQDLLSFRDKQIEVDGHLRLFKTV